MRNLRYVEWRTDAAGYVNIRYRVARVHLTPRAQKHRTAEKTRPQQTRRDQANYTDKTETEVNLSQSSTIQVTEPNLLPHSCQQERVFDNTDCKSHGVLGDKEERDAFGFIPKMKEESKSWLLTFVAVLFRDVDKFTDYFKINVTIKQKGLGSTQRFSGAQCVHFEKVTLLWNCYTLNLARVRSSETSLATSHAEVFTKVFMTIEMCYCFTQHRLVSSNRRFGKRTASFFVGKYPSSAARP